MNRLFPYTLLLASAALVYACSDDNKATPGTSSGDPPIGEEDGGGQVGEDGGGTEGGGGGDGGGSDGGNTIDPTGNPIMLGAPREIFAFGAFTDGPAWSARRDALFLSLPLATNPMGKGVLASVKLDGLFKVEHRTGVIANGTGVIGNTVDKEGNLYSAELKQITMTALPVTGELVPPTVISTSFGDPAAPFNGPNDLVVLADGTIFVTDPGYGTAGQAAIGYLFRIQPGTARPTVAEVADTYGDTATLTPNISPNGIAVSKDEKTLYVGMTLPDQSGMEKPFIRLYTIGAGGALTKGDKAFNQFPPGSAPDGIAVDENDNVYVALSKSPGSPAGIATFKKLANGQLEPYGGAQAKIPQTVMTDDPVGIAFGGTDRKSLIVTTKGGKPVAFMTLVAGLRH